MFGWGKKEEKKPPNPRRKQDLSNVSVDDILLDSHDRVMQEINIFAVFCDFMHVCNYVVVLYQGIQIIANI